MNLQERNQKIIDAVIETAIPGQKPGDTLKLCAYIYLDSIKQLLRF